MNHRSISLCIAIVILATDAFPQVSEENRNLAMSAVQYLMTKPERTAWESVRNDDDARQFMDAFWARRDPTPGTPANEFRESTEQRTREADKRFADRQSIGSLTDRGKVFVLFGEPDHIDLSPNVSWSSGSSMSRFDRRPEAELWIYRGANAARLGSKAGDLGILFSDEITAGRMELVAGSRRLVETAAILVAREAFEKGRAAAAKQSEVLALRLIVVGDEATAESIVRQVREGAEFAALARRMSTHASGPAGGFIGKVRRGDLTGDFEAALSSAEPGAVVVIQRTPTEFAVVQVLTPEEAARIESLK